MLCWQHIPAFNMLINIAKSVSANGISGLSANRHQTRGTCYLSTWHYMFWLPLDSPWGCGCVPTGSCQSGLPQYWDPSPWQPPRTANRPPVYSLQKPPLEAGTACCPEKSQGEKKRARWDFIFSHFTTFLYFSMQLFQKLYIHIELLKKASKEWKSSSRWQLWLSCQEHSWREKKHIKGVAGKLNKRSHSPVWLYFRICCNLKVFSSGCKLVSVTNESNFTHYPVWIDCRPCRTWIVWITIFKREVVCTCSLISNPVSYFSHWLMK